MIYRLTRIYTCRGKLHCYTNAKSVSACSRCRAQIEIFHVLKSVMVLFFLGFYYNRVRGFCAINTNTCTKSTHLRLILPHPCSFHGLLFNYNLFLRRPPGPLSLELSFRPPFWPFPFFALHTQTNGVFALLTKLIIIGPTSTTPFGSLLFNFLTKPFSLFHQQMGH